jgi:hypothetical protein
MISMAEDIQFGRFFKSLWRAPDAVQFLSILTSYENLKKHHLNGGTEKILYDFLYNICPDVRLYGTHF